VSSLPRAQRRLCWVIAGGGTGGHVTPALAVAERARARGDEVLVLGGTRGLEGRLVPEAGFELIALPAPPLARSGLAARLRALPALAAACASAWRILGRRQADIVVSVGGYASVPAVVAAVLRRIPIALVEPNAIPGRANRLAARAAARIFVQFREAADVLPAAARARVELCGTPLRSALAERFRGATRERSRPPPLHLLVFGGSQGAHQINEAMAAIAARLDSARFEVFHQCGASDVEFVAEAYRKTGLRAEVVAFEPDMPRRYAWAHLALCRSGALTVAELALAGLPALLVPFPHAADDHQSANARALAGLGAAKVLSPRPLDPETLLSELTALAAEPAALAAMSRAAAAFAKPDAAEFVVASCAALAERERS
jgi:UDP-N-acetylglucosamine--N-acetylmuramyl-(pentapeptide) pyrophosphoryl-undecaprenol N-acetylglucosamine transferase